jgi:uncharacterized protein (TIGR02301 family)
MTNFIRQNIRYLALSALGVFALGGINIAAIAQPAPSPEYDRQLMRLAEILGAVHHLREICKANEGQLWREQMIKLLSAERPTAARRARLIKNFNQGYRSYKRTYRLCNQAANLAINRFVREGAGLAQSMAQIRLKAGQSQNPSNQTSPSAVNR